MTTPTITPTPLPPLQPPPLLAVDKDRRYSSPTKYIGWFMTMLLDGGFKRDPEEFRRAGRFVMATEKKPPPGSHAYPRSYHLRNAVVYAVGTGKEPKGGSGYGTSLTPGYKGIREWLTDTIDAQAIKAGLEELRVDDRGG